MKFLAVFLALITLACGETPSDGGSAGVPARTEDPIVVMFIVDGIDSNTVLTAVDNGAATVADLLQHGVTVERFFCTSPAPRLRLPDGSLPWGGSTSANVALHTGCHLFESRKMDDIFLNARRAGIVSMFAGGSANYSVFDTVDHLYSGADFTDEEVVDRGLQHFHEDGARLLRLHLQRIRDHWSGPDDTTDPDSDYIQYFVNRVDPLLAKLIGALRRAGVWERTFLIFGSDHGMGQTSASNHPQSVLSSWLTFMAFRGPGVKQGAKIAYAEGPDVALMANHFLELPPLQGHLETGLPDHLRGPSGTFLAHILEGGPSDIEHPRLIERFLDSGLTGDDYEEYRQGMLRLIAQ